MPEPRRYPLQKPAQVYLFGTCVVGLCFPEAGLYAIRLLEREGIRVHFPQGQSRCGQPAFTKRLQGASAGSRAGPAGAVRGRLPGGGGIRFLRREAARALRRAVPGQRAETVDEANALVLAIIRAHEARQVIKGSSMVSEEMDLNQVLAAQGIECLESEMGEFIVQLDHEKPSHIIMPAIHKNAGQVASLFHDKLGVESTRDVDQFIQTGRRVLRRKFFEADIQQVLAYGAHGPKDLIELILEDA